MLSRVRLIDGYLKERMMSPRLMRSCPRRRRLAVGADEETGGRGAHSNPPSGLVEPVCC